MADSFPTLFIIAISIAGTIPIKGPTIGMRFARPAMTPIKSTKVMFAPDLFKISKPKIDKIETLLATKFVLEGTLRFVVQYYR